MKSIGESLSFFDNNEKQVKETLQRGASNEKPWAKMTDDEKAKALLEMFLRTMPWAGSKPKFDLEFLIDLYRRTEDATWDDLRAAKEYCDDYFNTPGNEKEMSRYTNLRTHFKYRLDMRMSWVRKNLHKNKKKTATDAPKGVMLRCPNCGMKFLSTTATHCLICKIKGVAHT